MWLLCWLLGTSVLGWLGFDRKEGGAVGFKFTSNKTLMTNVYLILTMFQGQCCLRVSHIILSAACETQGRACYHHVHFVGDETEAQKH